MTEEMLADKKIYRPEEVRVVGMDMYIAGKFVARFSSNEVAIIHMGLLCHCWDLQQQIDDVCRSWKGIA